MTDETYVFKETERERKRTARGAFSKKGGSRSKKCTLPSDRLTEKQRKELNGEVYSYDVNKPMDWSTFVYMPQDIQLEYLKKLCSVHGGRLKDAADMFGIASGSLSNYICRHFNGIHPFAALNGQKGVSLDWLRFTQPESFKEPEVKEPPAEEKSPPEPTSCVKLAEDAYPFALDSGELRFVGNLRAILSKMLIVLEPSSDYDLTITFKKT